MDLVWQEALDELETLNLLQQAYRLGELAAWQHNKMMDTGVSSLVEYRRIGDAYERAERIADILGEPARESFAAGFDATIDFSLNTDWQATKGREEDARTEQER